MNNESPLPTSNASDTAAAPVVLVDLDGTLLRSDVLWESLMVLARKRPWSFFPMIFYAFRGRAKLKEELAKRVVIEADTLPYCPEVLEGIREQRALGRKVILATATIESVANAVAEHLKAFDSVLATSGGVNRKGAAKLAAITEIFEGQTFEYWGDSTADIPLFEAASGCVVVRPKGKVRRHVATLTKPVRIIERPEKRLTTVLGALRVDRWGKNLLLFLPLLFAMPVGWRVIGLTMIAFLVFCLAASANYIVDALLDLPADRRDPVKRSRPIACGALPIPSAIQLSTLLFLIALVMSVAFLPWSFTGWVALYLVLASVRSFWLYPFPIVNVIVLAALFSLRIPAGAAAAGLANPIGLQALCGGIYCVYALLKRQRRERLSA